MPDTSSPSSASPSLFARRNLVWGVAGVVTIVTGYVVLASGSASLAAVLLVIGYVVLVPTALLA
jgi:uncharacterized membrane protein HdeD (DUF308 family)